MPELNLKLTSNDRDKIRFEAAKSEGPAWSGSSKPMQELILRVLLSIDQRLADTNDFYLQNQEKRAQT